MVAFLREQFHEVTSADSRLWRSLRAVFVPGKLTEEYFAGRRGLYLRPIRLFIFANIAFFLLLTWSGANSSLQGHAESHRGAWLYGDWATEQLAEAAAEAGLAPAAYDTAFDQRSRALASTLVGTLVPGFALVLALTLFWTGASGVRHLVFATHFTTFAMAGSVVVALAFMVAITVVQAVGLERGLGYSIDTTFAVVLSLYFVVAVRRVYRLHWWQAAGIAVPALGFGIVSSMLFYRFVLFVVTLRTVDVAA